LPGNGEQRCADPQTCDHADKRAVFFSSQAETRTCPSAYPCDAEPTAEIEHLQRQAREAYRMASKSPFSADRLRFTAIGDEFRRRIDTLKIEATVELAAAGHANARQP